MEEYSLTEEAIGELCTESSFERGYEYFNESAVLWVTRRGSQLFGEVQGSEYDPYGVCVTFNGAELIAADCTCPYDWGGYCKHIVATLLTCLHDSDSVLERPPLVRVTRCIEPGPTPGTRRRIVRTIPPLDQPHR